MRKITSLTLVASIMFQILLPTTWLLTYAQTEAPLYGFQWEKDRSLNRNLELNNIKPGETEALVSWKMGNEIGSYILEYFIEKASDSGEAEKVQLEFKRDGSNQSIAQVIVKVLDSRGDVIPKTYREYDFNNPNEDKWNQSSNTQQVTTNVSRGSKYPGGRIGVGANMEIRFRWGTDNTIYVQTNSIKNGNITPFKLQHDSINVGEDATIYILTALEGYRISPVHISETTGESKVMVEVPSEEHPGSKPGIKIQLKRPKDFNFSSFQYKELTEENAKKIGATLVISDLTDTAKAQLAFNLGSGAKITGIDNQTGEKTLTYENGTYSMYLAKDDLGSEEIVKWEALKESLIFKQVDLSLIKHEGAKVQALGTFAPIDKGLGDDIGRYTYLGYTIKRSSIQDAYIEVQPYKGTANTEFTYSVQMSSDGGNWNTLVEHKYMPISNDEAIPFTIPVPFSFTHSNQYYKITVKYSQGTIYSQTLHYKPDKDLTIPPPTPIIQSVDNIYVVPPAKIGHQPEAIGFNLTWSAPKNSNPDNLLSKLLEQGNIYYELYLHDDKEAEAGTLINVFKVSMDNDNNIIVDPFGGSSGKSVLPKMRYNSSDDTFTMENVVLKNPGKDKWEQIVGMEADYETNTKYPQLTKDNIQDNLDKSVPNVYYLTMRALYNPRDTEAGTAIKMGVSNGSNPKSISLSLLEEVIPVPTQIESKNLPDETDTNAIVQSLSWGNIDLARYKMQMLDPLNLSISNDSKRTYEVYLYQKKNIKESELIETTPGAINLEIANSVAELEKEHIETLRNGGIVRLDYTGTSSTGMNNIKIENLDANQVYYVTMRVRLDITGDKGGESRHSVFSKEHSFTTYSRPSEPAPGERVPSVPEELRVISQLNNTTATIGWKAPNYTKQDDEELYYEIIRIDSRTLVKQEDSRMLSVEKLISGDTKGEIEAWRTKEPFVYKYSKGTSVWEQAILQQASNRLQLEDAGLNPNKIYYYYVRTVLVIDGEEVYSSWVGIPVTTDPIQKPIMLKVEDKDTYSHDPKREIVVSFLAPIPQDASVPGEYDFDIAVQGELDEEYRLDYTTTRLTSKEESKNIPTGYTHFVYKISNAKPGKRYDIKVRVVDKVKGMVNNEYPKSLYSDRVTTRTHFDQDEQDKDDKFAEYIKYFEDKTEALRRKSYWSLDEGKSTFAIKYRSNYIMPEMGATRTYSLEAKEGVLDFNYYMPASVITSANLDQISFEVKQDTITYTIRPSMITTELEELQAILEDIGEKKIRDYYVLFQFSQVSRATSKEEYLTPEIIVSIDLVRLKEEDLIIEDDIMIALNKRIGQEKSNFINDLEKALERGKILSADLDIIINDSINEIEKRHQSDVKSIIRSNSNRTVSIDNWNKQMLIMATIDSTAIAEGYFIDKTNVPLPTFNVAGGYGIEADKPGSYIFMGQKIVMPTIPGVGSASNIVAKYQLTDFFGTNGVINPSSPATKRSVLGAMARVLGAPRGADYNQYLKQANIKGVTNLGMDSSIKKGEAIYLIMQVYETNMKKPIGSVYVKNRTAVSNIRDFNPLHQPYVLVAVDSKIISGNIKPHDTMQIKDVLQMLTNILTGQR